MKSLTLIAVTVIALVGVAIAQEHSTSSQASTHGQQIHTPDQINGKMARHRCLREPKWPCLKAIPPKKALSRWRFYYPMVSQFLHTHIPLSNTSQ